MLISNYCRNVLNVDRKKSNVREMEQQYQVGKKCEETIMTFGEFEIDKKSLIL